MPTTTDRTRPQASPAPPRREVEMTLVGTDRKVRALEFAPGIYVPRSSAEVAEQVPRYGIAQLMRQADGSYLPVLRSWATTIRLKGNQDRIRELLGADLGYKVLLRLLKAGFIRGSYATPGTTLIDLASLADHLAAAADPEFWTPVRRAAYAATCGEV